MRRLRCAGCGVLLALAIIPAAQAHPVDKLLGEVLSGNPAVRSAEAERRGAERDIRVAKLQRLPAPSVSTQVVDGEIGSVLNVDQPLWTGGALTGRIRHAELLSRSAGAQVDVAKEQLAIRLLDAWQSLQAADGSLQAQERALQSFSRYDAMMRRRVEAQVSAGVELTLLSSRIQQMQASAEESRALKRVSLARISQLAGRPLTEAEVQGLLVSVPSTDPQLQLWARPSTLENLLDRLPQTAQVRKAQFDAEAGEARLKVQKAQRWPQVVARFQRQLSGTDDFPTGDNQFWIGLAYQPGGGFSSFAQARGDAERQVALEAAVDSASQDAWEGVHVEWENLRRELERQSTLGQAIVSAEEVQASYERQFVAGRKSWLDVLNALREVSQNQVGLAQAQAGAAAAFYRLRFRSGDWSLSL